MKVLQAIGSVVVFGLAGFGLLCLTPSADGRQYRNAEGNSVSNGVVLEIGDQPISPSNPIPSAPVPPTWSPVQSNVIASTGTYQTLCATARAGGTIQHQGDAGSPPLWIDVTGATGSFRSKAAMEVVARASASTAPGVYRFPATAGSVTIMGEAGETFQAFCG